MNDFQIKLNCGAMVAQLDRTKRISPMKNETVCGEEDTTHLSIKDCISTNLRYVKQYLRNFLRLPLRTIGTIIFTSVAQWWRKTFLNDI